MAAPVVAGKAPAPPVRRAHALLGAPRKPTPRENLPAALHLAVTAGASMFIAATVFIAGHELLKPPRSLQVMNGASLAALTIAIVAQPELGSSARIGLQRIAGVMIGGWLFCGLYLAYPVWWFLAIMLGAFTFAAAASSFYFTDKEAMYPPMIVAAFVVCVGFATPQAAVSGTVVKTAGIAGGILVYTLLSSLLFPRTATEQMLHKLGLALRELRDLADELMRSGRSAAMPSGADGGSANGAAAVDTSAVGVKAAGAAPLSLATLAATVPKHLADVQKLVPATSREHYVGRLPGGYMCFRPRVIKRTHQFQPDTLAVVHVAHMVHRALWLMIANEDHVAEGQPGTWLRVPEALGGAAHETLAAMADAAVCALSEFADALPTGAGRPHAVRAAAGVAVDRYVELCESLFRQSLALHGGTAVPGGGCGSSGCSDTGPRGRWRSAIRRIIMTRGGRHSHTGALAELVGSMLARGDLGATRWCASLLLLQQLGVGLCRLEDCLAELVPKVPGVGGAELLRAKSSSTDMV